MENNNVGLNQTVANLADAINFFKKVCESITEFWRKFVKTAKRIIGIYYNLPGYKRYNKREEIRYYQSIAEGKSNNWRKLHGLPMISRR